MRPTRSPSPLRTLITASAGSAWQPFQPKVPSDMIGKLKGKVDAVGESYLVIDVNGVGYEVQASSRTLRNLKPGDESR